MKITRTVYASFIIAVNLKSRKLSESNKAKHIIKKQNLRSTATVPRKLCFKYFVLYLKSGCSYNLMLNSFKSVPRGLQSNLAKLKGLKRSCR